MSPNITLSARGAQGRIVPFRNSFDPHASQDMLYRKQGEHSHADPLMGCLTHRSLIIKSGMDTDMAASTDSFILKIVIFLC